jgi:DNA invertase Pin-like site-specific DNA recombinase
MMRTAIYAGVSTPAQARAQRIDEQLERLKAYAEQKGLGLEQEHIYLDEGYSGASLNLGQRVRVRLKRNPKPSAAIVDSQSLKTKQAWAEKSVVIE